MGNGKRIFVVDALRGFALMGIMLIHSIEHFDFFYKPEFNFLFSPELDNNILNLAFLLFGGKAYSIFALMFGLSFFIQMESNKIKGIDFRLKFAWHLIILLFFGFIHSLFYQGDILHIYALLGLLLLFFDKLSSKALSFLAIVLALQIPLIINTIIAFQNPDFQYVESFGQNYWGEGSQTFANGNFIDVIKFNIIKGRSAVWGWTFYNGRYLQLIALFITGLLIGRSKLFANFEQNKKLFLRVFFVGISFVSILFIITQFLEEFSLSNVQENLLGRIIKSYYDLGFTSIIVSGFSLLYFYKNKFFFFKYLSLYGRMSLTNYIAQSIIGVFIFYNFGLGMYRYMGATWSLIYGILFLILQLWINKLWFNNFHYGPLEWLWRAMTFRDFSIKFKK